MITTLIDKFWPIQRKLEIGDRVTDSQRYGTITDIIANNYYTVQWDLDNQVVHLSEELKITRKRKK